jgi:outer membrane protein assembly factor BamB
VSTSTRLSLLLLAGTLALGACSKEKEIEKPAELVDIKTTLRVDRLWSSGVGGGKEELRLGLGAAAEGRRVFAAGYDGDVVALDLQSGRTLWRTDTKAPLSGGTGAGQGLVVVGSTEGEIILLTQSDGAIRWRVRVNGEVLAAPAISAASVIVRTVDGKLRGLALDDGRELWSLEQPVPRLSLRGTAAPVVAGDVAVCGFDNGKVAAVSVSDGEVRWEATISSARGRTELERMNDIDSAVQVLGQDVLVVGFQGRAAMLALDSGQVWWSRELSSYRGLAADDTAVYVATADGDIVALQRRTGVELWRQDALKRRGVAAPAILGGALAVADFDGVVHWLDRATGAFIARGSAGGRVSNPPLVVDGTLLIIDDAGKITAFRPREIAAAAPAAAPEPAATPAPPPPAG